MKKIEHYIGTAPKLSHDGTIEYALWVNERGILYIQLQDNVKSGTFSDLLFSVADYESKRTDSHAIESLKGYDIKDRKVRSSKNSNDGAFLKAALQHLLPSSEH